METTIPQSPILEAIHRRRSIREFTGEAVDEALLVQIVTAGIQAPSGLNNQPWRFAIIRDAAVRSRLAEQTSYRHIVLAAQALIVVFLDRRAMYDHTKDTQSAGACIQNMLLAAEALGLGAVWLGQILKNAGKVREILELSEDFLLMAVLAVGHPAHHNQHSERRPLSDFILKSL